MKRIDRLLNDARGRVLLILLSAVLTGSACRVHAGVPQSYELADLKALQRAFVKLADEVRPGVVAIKTYATYQHRRPGRVRRPMSHGSGFIIRSDGHIVTNAHVIAGADVIIVVLHNGSRHEAVIRQSDPRSDLAVIKIDATGLASVPIGDAAKLRINQWAFVCGNPFGLANRSGQTSMTFGVVSALGRDMTDQLASNPNEYYGNLIETSAGINPGSSGGPLFNIDGEVVGVVTAIETSSGVTEGHGFAIPLNRDTRRIIDTLAAGRKMRYGYLGVVLGDGYRGRRRQGESEGARIARIERDDYPAARANLQRGDIVIEFAGVRVKNQDHLIRLVGFTPAGTKAPVVYRRNGKLARTVVTVGDRFELLHPKADKED